MVREFAIVSAPYCYRCAYDWHRRLLQLRPATCRRIEQAIADSQGKVAAVILEPVSGATLGAVVPPDGYLERLQKFAAQTASCSLRTKSCPAWAVPDANFAVDHWNVAPDILVTAKGLSSGYAPLGAAVISKKVVEAIATGSGSFIHGFTYSSHPISLAAGRAVLNYTKDMNLLEAADSDAQAAWHPR